MVCVEWSCQSKVSQCKLFERKFSFSLYIDADECMADVRLMHLKLLLQNGPKYSAADAISNQCAWNNEPIDYHTVFNSFLMSIVGHDFATRQKILQEILAKCDVWDAENWKYLLLLLRMAVETNGCQHFSTDEQNKLKALAKSE